MCLIFVYVKFTRNGLDGGVKIVAEYSCGLVGRLYLVCNVIKVTVCVF